MSRAGGKASKQRKQEREQVEAVYRRIDEFARADVMLVACEACGLEQVQPSSPPGTAIPGVDGELLPRAGTVCVLCGNETARFLTSAPDRP